MESRLKWYFCDKYYAHNFIWMNISEKCINMIHSLQKLLHGQFALTNIQAINHCLRSPKKFHIKKRKHNKKGKSNQNNLTIWGLPRSINDTCKTPNTFIWKTWKRIWIRGNKIQLKRGNFFFYCIVIFNQNKSLWICIIQFQQWKCEVEQKTMASYVRD